MSLTQNYHHRRSLYLEAHALDVPCDRGRVRDSATESRVTPNKASQVIDAMDKGLDILSAQLESSRVAKMKPAQKKNGILCGLLQGLSPSSWAREPAKRNLRQRTARSSRVAQRGGREREDLSSRLEFLQAELDAKNMELRETRAETLRFKEQAEEFREILLAEAGNQKVSDDEVIQLFVRMRQRALALAKNRALRFDLVPVIEQNTNQRFKDFYCNEAWDSWKPKDRELHVRERIFTLLFRSILDKPFFGIEGYPVTQPVGRVAQGLSDFETAMKKKILMSNWRLATIECVEALGVQSERLSERVAAALLQFLAPILNDQSQSSKERLRSLALNLCKDAFNLTIMMRKSRDEYRCDAIEDRIPTADVESWAEAHAVDEGANSEAGDNIAYVLFGALAKKFTYHGGTERVLVKAEVVMERKASP